jgi:hypothetical protein
MPNRVLIAGHSQVKYFDQSFQSFSRLRTAFKLSERLLVMPEYGSNIPGYSSITHFPE